MKIQKQGPTTYQKPQQKDNKSKCISPSEMKLYNYQWESLIQFGKYKGFTLKHVGNRHPKYLEWMNEEGLLITWGLLLRKEEKPIVQKSAKFYSPTYGCYWLSIYEVTD